MIQGKNKPNVQINLVLVLHVLSLFFYFINSTAFHFGQCMLLSLSTKDLDVPVKSKRVRQRGYRPKRYPLQSKEAILCAYVHLKVIQQFIKNVQITKCLPSPSTQFPF